MERNRIYVDEEEESLLEWLALEEQTKTDPLAALEPLPRAGWWACLRRKLARWID